jgi:putative DNA primase/helicase
MDPLQSFKEFVAECCLLGPSHRVQSGHMYRHYKNWCADNGKRDLSLQVIAPELERMGIKKRKGAPVIYLGIGVKPEQR